MRNNKLKLSYKFCDEIVDVNMKIQIIYEKQFTAVRSRIRHGDGLVADWLILQRHHIARDVVPVCLVCIHPDLPTVDQL